MRREDEDDREDRDAKGRKATLLPPRPEGLRTFLKTSEETGGERTLIEIELAPGGGNQPHYHLTYDEHFEALEGAHHDAPSNRKETHQR